MNTVQGDNPSVCIGVRPPKKHWTIEMTYSHNQKLMNNEHR